MQQSPLGRGSEVIGIVIVAHGGLAQEYRRTVEHVLGAQSQMQTISVEVDTNRTAKSHEITSAANAVDSGAGVVVVSDIFGGSPSNLCGSACAQKNRRFIYGANVPLLIKLTKVRNLSLDQAVTAALQAGHRYMGSQAPREEQI